MWKKKQLGEVANYVNGRAFKPKEWKKNGLPIIRIQNLNDETAPFNYSDVEHKEKYLVKNGDLLFAWSASLGAYIWKGGDAWLNQHIFRVDHDESINKKYLYYCLTNVVDKLYAKSHGSGMVHVTKGKFEETEVPVPSIEEQNRIVEKIEELFSELDNGIENLKKAQKQLKTYRQSVLKDAFEGKLTKEWREQQADLPTPDELLQQIKAERKAHRQRELAEWEKEVGQWEKSGKPGRKPRKSRNLDISTNDDFEPNIRTPNEWKLCQIGDIHIDLTDYHANGSYKVLKKNVELYDNPDYAIMIRATNFEKNDFKNDLKFIDEHAYEFLSKSKLFGGEILIGKIGNAGRIYLMPNLDQKASLAMNLFALRFEHINTKFMYYQLKSISQEKEIQNYVKGVANPTINKLSVRSIHVNICSKHEQEKVVEEIESRLSIVDQLEQTIKENLQKAEALRQSILKKAFGGELVEELK